MKTGKSEALTYREMEQMNQEIVSGNQLYLDQGVSKREAISGIIDHIAQDVAKERTKIDLRDTAAVQEVARQYLEACRNTSVLPSKAGLARALGYSRTGVWMFIRDHPTHKTSEALNILYDSFAEAMDLAALGGAVHAIYSIWIEKSQFEMRDNTPLDPPPKPDPLGPCKTEEELREIFARYAELDDLEVNTGDESP